MIIARTKQNGGGGKPEMGRGKPGRRRKPSRAWNRNRKLQRGRHSELQNKKFPPFDLPVFYHSGIWRGKWPSPCAISLAWRCIIPIGRMSLTGSLPFPLSIFLARWIHWFAYFVVDRTYGCNPLEFVYHSWYTNMLLHTQKKCENCLLTLIDYELILHMNYFISSGKQTFF